MTKMTKCILVVAIITLGFSAFALSLTTDDEILRDTFLHPSCTHSCYLGIEPGITTRQQLETILDAQDISYNIQPVHNDFSDSTYNWSSDDVLSTNISVRGARAFVENDVVYQLGLSVEIPVSSILNAFGNPDVVRDDDVSYDIIYHEEGLAFTLSTFMDPTIVGTAFIIDPNLTRPTILSANFADGVSQTCTTYGAPPCIAPTAEPNQSPVADAGTNAQSQPGYLCHVVAATDTCQFQLDASGSSDPDGTLVAYQWAYRPVNTSDWSPIDPNVTEYTSPTVFFSPTPGDYEVRVRVRDDDFATAEAVTSMEVNRRPTIVIDPTLPICTVDSAGQSCTITVDAGQSSDPDGTVERYLWYVRLPDGSQPLLGETTAADPTWDYTLQSGQHNLVLRIIDNDGGTRGKLFQAIANIRPVADAGADQDVYVWPGNPRTGAFPYSAPITLDGTDSSDPDGIIFTYEWYRIQNNLSTGTETRSSIGNGATLQYNAGVTGCVQTIELVVTDNHAATHADRMSVNVSGDGALTPPGGCGGVFTP